MDNTIDTLVIKVEGKDASAESTLDKVISKLESIKNAGNDSSGSISGLNKQLSSLKSTVDNLKSNKFKQFTSSAAKASSKAQQFSERVSEKTASSFSGAEQVTVSSESVARASRFSGKISEIKERFVSASAGAKSFGSQVKTAFSTTIVGKFASKIKSLITTIGRIAMYRVIRSAIRQVTEAFTTGINDMYQYSKSFSGSFSTSMDRAASSLLSFKNSLAAAVTPLIEYLVPYLDKAVDRLMEINNTISMVIAGLTGKSTYSKAVRVTTEYAKAADDAADKTSNVTEKVEELKRSFAGLDEITVIGDNTSSLSSSAGGNNSVTDGVDYKSMFVETPVDMAKVNQIKDTFEKIWKYAKWIGLAIAAWKLVSFISSIAQAISSLGTLSSKLLGISMMIVGFGIEFAGAYDIGKNGLNLKNVILTAIGSALGVAGSILTFGTTPVGWAIGLAVAFTVLMTGIAFGQMDAGKEIAQQTEFWKAVEQISVEAQAASARASEALSAMNDKVVSLDTTLAEFSAAQALVDEIFDIYEKSNLSSSEIELLKTKIDTLNGLNIDGLQLEFDETSGTLYQIGEDASGATEKIVATRDSIKKVTEALKEQAIQAALNDILTESYKRLFEAQLDAEERNNAVTDAQNALKYAAQEYVNYLQGEYVQKGVILGAKKLGELKEQYDNAKDALNDAKQAQEDNNSVLVEAQSKIDAATRALTDMKTGATNYANPATTSTDILNSSLKTGKDNTADLKNAFKNFSADSTVKNYAKDATTSTQNLADIEGVARDTLNSAKDSARNFKNDYTASTFANNATQSAKDLSGSLNDASNDALKLKNSLSQIDGFSGNYSYTYSFGNTPKYATGGFPEDGFFFANHNELVGQFSNGRTAVANNEQIVEGISEGVESANEETNRLLRLVVGLLERQLQKDSSIPVSSITNAYIRQAQRNGTPTVPVNT